MTDLRTIAAFDRIGEENAFAVLARANALAAQGRDIISLGIGQPDFRTPEHIVEAAIKALRDGHHGYTPATGILPLREAITADVMRANGFNVGLDLEAYEPVGCARCGGSGYKGRIGLYEVMWVSDTIRSLAVAREPAETIAHAAVHEGMMRLREDGLEKVRRGLTSIAEIARVAGTR